MEYTSPFKYRYVHLLNVERQCAFNSPQLVPATTWLPRACNFSSPHSGIIVNRIHRLLCYSLAPKVLSSLAAANYNEIRHPTERGYCHVCGNWTLQVTISGSKGTCAALNVILTFSISCAEIEGDDAPAVKVHRNGWYTIRNISRRNMQVGSGINWCIKSSPLQMVSD